MVASGGAGESSTLPAPLPPPVVAPTPSDRPPSLTLLRPHARRPFALRRAFAPATPGELPAIPGYRGTLPTGEAPAVQMHPRAQGVAGRARVDGSQRGGVETGELARPGAGGFASAPIMLATPLHAYGPALPYGYRPHREGEETAPAPSQDGGGGAPQQGGAAPARRDAPRLGESAPRNLTGPQLATAAPGSVPRQLMDLIGRSEGTDRGRGYDETLGYGAYTGGAVDLQGKTIAEVRQLQREMLRHPANRWNSSAVGRYQIVGTTLQSAIEAGVVKPEDRFDAATQDRLAMWLMERRGLSRFQRGEMSREQFQNNLAREWASLPTTGGGGFYAGQRSHVSGAQVADALMPRPQLAGTDAPHGLQARQNTAAPVELRMQGADLPDVVGLEAPPGGLPTPANPDRPGLPATDYARPLPQGERERIGAGAAGNQRVDVTGAFAPLRVEHVSGTTGEVEGTEYLPVTAFNLPQAWGKVA